MRDQLRILSVVMVDQIPLFLMSDFGDGVDINRASSTGAEPSRCPADVTAGVRPTSRSIHMMLPWRRSWFADFGAIVWFPTIVPLGRPYRWVNSCYGIIARLVQGCM